MKISLLGAAGGIGQSLALLLKTTCSADSSLALYDINPAVQGVALDLSHIPSSVQVAGYQKEELGAALKDSDIVFITAGLPRKPGMDRDDLFAINAKITQELIENVAEYSPQAIISLVTNPLNSMLPLAVEVLKKKGVYDARKVFGVTSLDLIRAQAFIAEYSHLSAEKIHVDVIGGHSGKTILPLLSQVYALKGHPHDRAELSQKLRQAGTSVVEAKGGAGSATLSMAQASLEFITALIRSKEGHMTRTCAYIPTEKEVLPFFAKPIMLGKHGLSEELHYGSLDELEQQELESLLPILEADIQKGLSFKV